MEKLRAAVMFVVIREDAVSFRPNHEACPSFARYLREAQEAGVQGRRNRLNAVWSTEFPIPSCREVSSCFVLGVPLPCLGSS